MYAHIDQFPIDKAVNTIIEEGIAPVYIKAYYAAQGKKINRVTKFLGDEKTSKAYDLLDTFGVTWEVKADRLWHLTGNVYVELQALEASQADKYLIFAGKGFIIEKSRLWDAISGMPAFAGGDFDRSLGVKLPLERLEEVAEDVIVL